MPRFALPLLAASTLSGLAACASVTSGAETAAQLPRMAVEGTVGFFENVFKRPELAVEAIEVGRNQYCHSAGRESAIEVFDDVGAIRTWQQGRNVQLVPGGGELPQGRYVIAEMGERNTGGYALAISRQAAVVDDTLYVKATYLVPSNAGMVTEAFTAPCSLVQVPNRPFARVLLVDQTNKVRARWTASGGKG